MGIDRFGNPHASNLSYARGEILRSTEDDFQKLQRAWSLIRERGPGSTYVLTGLEHSLPLAAEELEFADDEIAPAMSFERLKELALDHLGGSPETDDVAVFNRLTGATMATHLTLVKPGDVVIGVSATHSHPLGRPGRRACWRTVYRHCRAWCVSRHNRDRALGSSRRADPSRCDL
jgi:L-seryl-tRNA(Ser) seleniumtransferase